MINKYLSKKQFFLVVSVFLLVLLAGVYIFYFPMSYKADPTITLKIAPGMGFSQVTDSLIAKGIPVNKSLFKMAALFYGAEKRIKAGKYKIPGNLSYLDILDYLTGSKAEKSYLIDLYPGISVNGVINRLKGMGIVNDSVFLKLLSDSIYINKLTLGSNSFEGYLFPGKYIFYKNSNEKEVLEEITDSLFTFIANIKHLIDSSGMSLHEVLTLASIVNAESFHRSEMPTIAGVYLNRLKKGMRLQADPTVQYAMPERKKRLSFADLKFDSPYNTYLYDGLPPGPINNPGKDAIIAVLKPNEHKYLYFCANPQGKHEFAETYSEHLRNARIYQEWLNSKNITLQ